MDFRLSEELKMLQDMVRRFASEKVREASLKWDKNETFPREVISELAEMGLLGVFIPEEYGGAGMGFLAFLVALEELARQDAGIAFAVSSHNTPALSHILAFGSDAQKKKYLPVLASGAKLAAWALTEPAAGSDARAITLNAEKTKDGYLLNGEKAFISNGSVADVAIIMAATDSAEGKNGISAFIVEHGDKGLTQKEIKGKLGVRSSDLGSLKFENVLLPFDRLIGKEGEGFKQAMMVLEHSRAAMAAIGVGIAHGAIEEAVAWAKERDSFGKKVSEFQATQWKVAECATLTDGARLLVYLTGQMIDRGEAPKETASKAKLFAAEAAMRSAYDAIQILGGYGYTKEFFVERYYRDAKLVEIGEGTNEMQRLIIARQFLSA